jgi:uncharacterized protein (DUF2141 family)
MRLAATIALISLWPVAALAGGAPAGSSPPVPPSKQGVASSVSAPPTTAPAPKVAPKLSVSGKGAGKTEGRVQAVLVTVENVESNKGDVSVALCDKGLSKDGCPFGTGKTAVTGTMEFVFESIPPGNYAVVAFHDVNSNREFDQTLGVPREPYALSKDAANKMIPTFKDAALAIGEGETRVTIKMQRFLGR